MGKAGSEGMKLFVDDERRAPEGWNIARSSKSALVFLNFWRNGGSAVIDTISLDHDLSIHDGEDDTTRPLVLWMCRNEMWPKNVYVHTGNPVGEEWLVGMVLRYAPPGTLKGYGVNYWGTSGESVQRIEVRQ